MAPGAVRTFSSALLQNGSLPLFLSQKNKLFCLFFFGSLYVVFYGGSNYFPIFQPRLLPMTQLDELIPFWPNSVLIYVTALPMIVYVYMTGRDFTNINKYLYAVGALLISSGAIFWIWPTTYPRELFPTPE